VAAGRLRSNRIKPINNVVDVTNLYCTNSVSPYTLLMPISLKDGRSIVKNLPEGTPLLPSTGAEHKLGAMT